jgi:diacylglycerol kinase
MSRFDPKPRWAMGGSEPHRRTKPRRWREKFAEAGRGMKLGVRGHSSFYVHFFVAAAVVAVAVALQCNWVEWALLAGCIGGVFTAELFNSAIETLFHALDAETKNRMVGCLDIAAGAVLMASLTAAVVGAIVFGQRLVRLYG